MTLVTRELKRLDDSALFNLGLSLRTELFQAKMRKGLHLLDDTSRLRKLKKDIARVEHERGVRARTRVVPSHVGEKVEAVMAREVFTIDVEQEKETNRWFASVQRLPGVMAYGDTAENAAQNVKRLALEVLAEAAEDPRRLPTFYHPDAAHGCDFPVHVLEQ